MRPDEFLEIEDIMPEEYRDLVFVEPQLPIYSVSTQLGKFLVRATNEIEAQTYVTNIIGNGPSKRVYGVSLAHQDEIDFAQRVSTIPTSAPLHVLDNSSRGIRQRKDHKLAV
jgi:hypothetical protein